MSSLTLSPNLKTDGLVSGDPDQFSHVEIIFTPSLIYHIPHTVLMKGI
jgi:hypothetical protein